MDEAKGEQMHRVGIRRHWEELAELVAATTEQGADARLTTLVVRLERLVGLPPLPGPDPSGSVTARRFARVHAAALGAGGHLDDDLADALVLAIRELSRPRPAAGRPARVQPRAA